MKKGLNFHLEVSFDVDMDKVEKVEFAFSDGYDTPPIKREEYPGTGRVLKGKKCGTLLVPFTQDETYKFNGTVCMDTRITFKDTPDQPETSIVPFKINNTLFEEELM